MSIYYYKTDVGNIGDDLNDWLWKDIFEIDKIKEDSILIGFGSILTQNLSSLGEPPISSYKNKIILGAGIRSIDNLPEIDDSWDVQFLRGPISSLFLTNTLSNYITDGAYALRQHSKFDEILNREKKYEVSFMPYLRTSHLIPWKSICDELEIHYISPHSTSDIRGTLEEISASKLVITEAMHGAILADVCRVKWSKVQFAADIIEGGSVNETKWNDWARSVNVKFETNRLFEIPKKWTYIPQLLKLYLKVKKRSIINTVKVRLKEVSQKGHANLSQDAEIAEVDNRIGALLEDVKSRVYK